jgi:hypothetical protein
LGLVFWVRNCVLGGENLFILFFINRVWRFRWLGALRRRFGKPIWRTGSWGFLIWEMLGRYFLRRTGYLSGRAQGGERLGSDSLWRLFSLNRSCPRKSRLLPEDPNRWVIFSLIYIYILILVGDALGCREKNNYNNLK